MSVQGHCNGNVNVMRAFQHLQWNTTFSFLTCMWWRAAFPTFVTSPCTKKRLHFPQSLKIYLPYSDLITLTMRGPQSYTGPQHSQTLLTRWNMWNVWHSHVAVYGWFHEVIWKSDFILKSEASSEGRCPEGFLSREGNHPNCLRFFVFYHYTYIVHLYRSGSDQLVRRLFQFCLFSICLRLGLTGSHWVMFYLHKMQIDSNECQGLMESTNFISCMLALEMLSF